MISAIAIKKCTGWVGNITKETNMTIKALVNQISMGKSRGGSRIKEQSTGGTNG